MDGNLAINIKHAEPVLSLGSLRSHLHTSTSRATKPRPAALAGILLHLTLRCRDALLPSGRAHRPGDRRGQRRYRGHRRTKALRALAVLLLPLATVAGGGVPVPAQT